MDNEMIIEATEVNELVETTNALANPKVQMAGKIGIGVGLTAAVGGIIAVIVKNTKNWRIKKASEYLEKNGKIVLDSYDCDAEIDAEPVSLFSEEE